MRLCLVLVVVVVGRQAQPQGALLRLCVLVGSGNPLGFLHAVRVVSGPAARWIALGMTAPARAIASKHDFCQRRTVFHLDGHVKAAAKRTKRSTKTAGICLHSCACAITISRCTWVLVEPRMPSEPTAVQRVTVQVSAHRETVADPCGRAVDPPAFRRRSVAVVQPIPGSEPSERGIETASRTARGNGRGRGQVRVGSAARHLAAQPTGSHSPGTDTGHPSPCSNQAGAKRPGAPGLSH